MTLRFSRKAEAQLLGFERRVAQRVYKKLEWYISQEDRLSFAEPITGYRGRYRFRIGDYRVICDLSSENELCILWVLSVNHRKEVYRDL